MQIESINTSWVTTIDYQGKTVSTGIFKKPTSGPVMVRKLNIDGDKQADLKHHGGVDKAVYAFSSHHYPYWKAKLNNNELPAGSFGENLTISDLDESKIHIGDQVSIGDCLLEVSQPRVPCFKLGIAVDDKSMPSLFTQSAETGVYFRVVEEGAIRKNDDVRLVYSPDKSVTIKDLFSAIFAKGMLRQFRVLHQALECDALSSEWHSIVSSRLEKLDRPSPFLLP